VQRDREDAKTKCSRALQQLMRGIIDNVFGIIQGMDVQIDFDPIAVISGSGHRRNVTADFMPVALVLPLDLIFEHDCER
jgi:hypothetical protein